jgi:hypothetical protein
VGSTLCFFAGDLNSVDNSFVILRSTLVLEEGVFLAESSFVLGVLMRSRMVGISSSAKSKSDCR